MLLAASCATRAPGPRRLVTVAAPAAEPVAEGASELRLGEPVDRELARGETHAFTLAAAAGEYLRVVVRPRAMDVALRLSAPDGVPAAEADGPGGSKEREILSYVTTAAGAYRLHVVRRDDGELRHYKLELQERRPGLPDDAVRMQAERAFLEGLHRFSLATAEELEQAARLFDESLALWRTIDDGPGQVDCTNQLGSVAFRRGNPKEAAARFEEAQRLAEAAGYRRGLGEALNNLGLAHARLADPEATLRSYRGALAIWEELGDDLETARTWNNLGLFHLGRGESAPALASLEKALELRQAAGDVAGQAGTLWALGTLHLGLLETGSALDFLSRALPLSKAAGDLRVEALLLNSLAAVHRQRGDMLRALQLHREAADRFDALGNSTSLANVLEALGGLYLELGDFAKAAAQFERVLGIYRAQENRAMEARVLGTIGLTAFRQGNLQEALAGYGTALATSRAIRHPGTEITLLHNRGEAHRALGDLASARADLEGSLALQEETGNREEKASTLVDLGSVLNDLGEPAAAVERFREALDLARDTGYLTVQAGALLRWSELERDRGRLEAALPMIEEAVAIVESVRRGVVRQDLKETYFASYRTVYDVYVDLLMRLEETTPGRRFAERAFGISERSRARSLSELLAEGRIDVRRGIAGELREREIRVGGEISRVQSALAGERARPLRDEPRLAALQTELERVLDEREDLEGEIRVRHPRYAEMRYPEPLALAEVQRALGPRAALLEYAVGSRVSYLFVVTAEAFRAFRLPPAAAIQEEAERLRHALARPERRFLGRLQESAHALYRQLVAPAADLLQAKPEWIIAPDGVLHLVPFEALLGRPPDAAGPTGEPAYLVREHAIVYVPSAGVLRGLRAGEPAGEGEAPRAGRGFVAFADPLYGDPGDASLPALPGTRRETEAIAALYPAGEVGLFLGADATEENVKRGALAGARRIQFAVHGTFDAARPELSGLVLSRGDGSAEDGILQTYEIFNLDLAAELVVLSACETGLGRQLAGEGVVGLTRAFFYAGAPSVVVSLWRVADASTADIMIELHRRLNRGEGKAEALRGAKLHALASRQLAHPFHWASFVLVGDG